MTPPSAFVTHLRRSFKPANQTETNPTRRPAHLWIRLSSPAINAARRRAGREHSDETKLQRLRLGFAILTVQVKNVNLPDGPLLWVTFDGLSVGEIHLSHGSETMPAYSLWRLQRRRHREQIRVFDSRFPDASPFQQILIGGGFG